MLRGEKLTSSRLLAENIGVSRNTVELAYEKLVSEGLVINRARRGYFVENAAKPRESVKSPQRGTLVYDMRIKPCDTAKFPLMKWKQYAVKALTDSAVETNTTDFFGDMQIKSEISRFLYRYRKIECTEEDIFVFNGIESCLGILFTLIGGEGVKLPEEYQPENAIADLCGIDKNGGYIYTKPLFSKEKDFLKEKDFSGKKIIENDTGFMFAEDLMQRPALRAADKNVVYIGSFADIVYPAASVAYMVLPEGAKRKLSEISACYAGSDRITRRTLTYFMRDKNWERYLYRLSANEREKLALLKKICIEVFGRADKADAAAGTVTIERTAAEEITQKAEKAGVMTDFNGDSLILCARGMKKSDIEPAVRLIGSIVANG